MDEEFHAYRARFDMFNDVVASNHELLRQIRRLVIKYRYSDFSGDQKYRFDKIIEWLDTETDEKRAEFFAEIQRLAESFNIPEEFHGTLPGFVVLGSIDLPRRRGVSFRKRHGEPREIIIGPDTILNDFDLYLIRHNQRKILLEQDPPPPPRNTPGSRKKDWRPLWLWTKRHPNITHTELAKILDYDRSYLSRKLNELELR